MLARLIVDGFQGGTWLGQCRQNPLDRGKRERSVASGAFQSGAEIFLTIGRQQAENPWSLVLAVTAGTEELIEEGCRLASEFFKALAQQFLLAPQVRTGQVLFIGTFLAGLRSRQQLMASDLGDIRAIDDDFTLGDAHRQ